MTDQHDQDRTPPSTRCYRDGVLIDEGFGLEAVAEHLQSDGVVWVDLCPPDPADLQVVADELGLHSLALEDAMSDRERPKFYRYEGHDFLTLYAVQLDLATGELVASGISAFITPHALVTVRKDDHFSLAGLLEHWDSNADLTAYGDRCEDVGRRHRPETRPTSRRPRFTSALRKVAYV